MNTEVIQLPCRKKKKTPTRYRVKLSDVTEIRVTVKTCEIVHLTTSESTTGGGGAYRWRRITWNVMLLPRMCCLECTINDYGGRCNAQVFLSV